MSESDSTSLSAQVNRLNLNDTPNTSTASTEPSELVAVVDDLLNQLSSKFTAVSGEILTKMDEMSKRLDALEASIQTSNASSLNTAEGTGSSIGEEK